MLCGFITEQRPVIQQARPGELHLFSLEIQDPQDGMQYAKCLDGDASPVAS